MEKQLILSLDITNKNKALDIMNIAKDYIAMVKISHYIISSFSSSDIKEIIQDMPIMLDLKFYDIPNTVLNAVDSYTTALKNIKYFTFNGSMDNQTLEKISEIKSSKGVAVLVLSSQEINHNDFIQKAKINYNCGIRNFICPPAYITVLKNELDDITLFSPGVRSSNDKKDDHNETFSSVESINLGANYVIVGRPILTSKDIKAKIKEYL